MPMLDKALNTVIMPFGIKLKRTGRYILSHKNSFLIQVQLLDNTTMDCTLTVENTGLDCLNAVAQKLELRETKYFGLQYYNKQLKLRWVELDKPLKKQVDKNAHDPNLFLGVMFYVANIESLQQEITKYMFYLQLKNNVIDGLLQCNNDQAVELASYMLQAEFGDHDPNTHVVTYFRDYILFSEARTPDEQHLDLLTQKTIEFHKRHRGLSPSDAESNYILKAIHLAGFSEDIYPAKNGHGHDIKVGCSFAGVLIKSQQRLSSEVISFCHEWQRIENIALSKNTLNIEIRKEDTSSSLILFYLEDSDTAKYLWKLCESRWKFYLQNKESTRQVPLESEGETVIQRRPTLRRNPEVDSDEMEQRLVSVQPDYISSQENLQMHGGANEMGHYYSSQTSLDHAYVSQTSLNHQAQHEPGYVNGFGGSVYSSPSISSLVQSQIGRPSPATSNLSINSSQQRGINRMGLPIYRHSPDYEVAMRQRRRYSSYLENNLHMVHQSTNPQHVATNVPQPSLKPRPHSMIYSQQELVQQATHGPSYAPYPQQHSALNYRRSQPPLDSSVNNPHSHIHWDTSHESLSPPGGSQIADLRVTIPQDNRNYAAMTGSTPELAVQQQGKPFFVSEFQLHRHFVKPEPNLEQAAASTSTPDLSLYRHNGAVSASSPDLHLANMGSQPPRLHRPMPTLESYQQQGQMLGHSVTNHVNQAPDHLIRRAEQHNQALPSSSSFDQVEMRNMHTREQTPEQNVQAYLQQLQQASYGHHNPPVDATNYKMPYKRPLAGSREQLLQLESLEQNYGAQQRVSGIIQETRNNHEHYRKHQPNRNNMRQEQLRQKAEYHHSKAPSNATMLVYSSDSDGEFTNDYLLSQQLLQDRALKEVRMNRSQEYLGPDQTHHDPAHRLVQSMQKLNISGYLRGTETRPAPQKLRRPPPYPSNYSAQDEEIVKSDVENFSSLANPQDFSHNETSTLIQYADPQPYSVPNEPTTYSTHNESKSLSLASEPQTFSQHIDSQASTLPNTSHEQLDMSTRGPPPPYHSPSSSVLTPGMDLQSEDVIEESDENSHLFQNARRSTFRKMAPLKFAAMNGLNVQARSISPPLTKGEPDERALNLQVKVEEGHLLSEYDQIPMTRSGDFELKSLSSRDRVKGISPYKDCRVEISRSIDNPDGYINASHVKAVVAGYPWHYIACQTPLENHQNEMWDMVWRTGASIIVLIAKEVENGKTRCARYWPSSDDNQDIPHAMFGDYRVMCRCDSYALAGELQSRVTRNLVLEKMGCNETRIVWMLQYIGWPDSGVPKETDGFLAFMEELASVRRLAKDNVDSEIPPPVIVQCASGAGRSGTLILTELMMQCLEHNQDTTVSDMLRLIREQRRNSVQSFSQYKFVYSVLISFLRKSRLI